MVWCKWAGQEGWQATAQGRAALRGVDCDAPESHIDYRGKWMGLYVEPTPLPCMRPFDGFWPIRNKTVRPMWAKADNIMHACRVGRYMWGGGKRVQLSMYFITSHNSSSALRTVLAQISH